MSKCYKCGIPVECTIEFEEKLDNGMVIRGLKSVDHGCGEEFVHSQFTADQIGLGKGDIDKIFAAVSDAGGTMTVFHSEEE